RSRSDCNACDYSERIFAFVARDVFGPCSLRNVHSETCAFLFVLKLAIAIILNRTRAKTLGFPLLAESGVEFFSSSYSLGAGFVRVIFAGLGVNSFWTTIYRKYSVYSSS